MPILRFLFIILVTIVSTQAIASSDLSMEAVRLTTNADGTQSYSVTIQILIMMTVLTLLPAIVLMMTSFTRIIIVLSILRQAMGMPQTPSNQIVVGLSLFLSFYIMSPILGASYEAGIKPYIDGTVPQQTAIESAIQPLKDFMFNQTRKNDLALFMELSGNETDIDAKQIPLSVLIPSFVTSELKTAFQIGFMIFIPFLVIDLVVASVLMAMGMMMLSPLIISLPFKIMLFVLVDGWNLIMGLLANSFIIGS